MLIAIGFQAIEQSGELVHVPEADLQETVDVGTAEIPEEVREIVVLLLHAQKVEDDPAVTVAEHVGGATSRVGPECQRNQIEHGIYLFVEIRGLRGFSLQNPPCQFRMPADARCVSPSRGPRSDTGRGPGDLRNQQNAAMTWHRRSRDQADCSSRDVSAGD